MSSCERLGVPNHRQCDCLSKRFFRLGSTKALHHWSSWREPPMDTQRICNAGNVSISSHFHSTIPSHAWIRLQYAYRYRCNTDPNIRYLKAYLVNTIPVVNWSICSLKVLNLLACYINLEPRKLGFKWSLIEGCRDLRNSFAEIYSVHLKQYPEGFGTG